MKIDDLPPWIAKDYSGEIQAELARAVVHNIPAGENVEAGKLLLNVINAAGLELRSQIRFFRGYVPFAVVSLAVRSGGPMILPDSLFLGLTSSQARSAKALADEYLSMANNSADVVSTFAADSTPVGFTLASQVLARAANYAELANSLTAADDAANLLAVRNFSLGLTGNMFGVMDFALAQDKSSAGSWQRIMTSCGALVFTVAAAGSIPVAGIGLGLLVQAAGTFSSGWACGEQLELAFGSDLWNGLNNVYKEMMLVQTYSAERPGDSYLRGPGEGNIHIYDKNEFVKSIDHSDLYARQGELRCPSEKEIAEWEMIQLENGFKCTMERGTIDDDGNYEPNETIHCQKEFNEGTDDSTIEVVGGPPD